MHRLAKLPEDGRRQLVADFLDRAFGDLADDTAFAGIMRSLTPELPEEPEVAQVEAWVELVRLAQDPDFGACVRRPAASGIRGCRPWSTGGPRR